MTRDRKARVDRLAELVDGPDLVEVWMPCDDDFDLYESPQHEGERLTLSEIEARKLPPGMRQVVVLYGGKHAEA